MDSRENSSPAAGRSGATPLPTPVSIGGLGLLIVLGGTAITAVGVALTVAVDRVPRGEWIAAKLGEAGLASGALAATGLVLATVGLAMRSMARAHHKALSRASIPREPKPPQQLLTLTEDQSKIRMAMGNVQAELLANKARQDSILDVLRDVSGFVHNEQAQANAMFRLAASLDQLGARIEQRLKNQQESMQTRIEEVATTIEESRQGLMQAISELARELRTSNRAPLPARTYASNEETETEYEDDLGWEESADSSDGDEFVIEVELEEAAPELGLLDEFDEMGNMRDNPSPPAPLPRSGGTGDANGKASPGSIPFEPRTR